MGILNEKMCEMSDKKYNYYKDRITIYNETKTNKNNINL